MPSVRGRSRSRTTRSGRCRSRRSGHLFRVARDDRGVARVLEDAPHVEQILRIVVHGQDADRPGRTSAPAAHRPRRARRGPDTRILGDGNREGEARARTRSRAVGPDAAPVRLYDALADREPQAGSDAARAVLPAAAGELPEQARQTLGRDAGALVDDRHRHVHPLVHRRHPDRRRLGRVPGGVREQVAQDLDDALPVREHPRQVRRQVDQHGVPAPAAEVQGPGLLHDGLQTRRLGRDRQPARLDLRRVQQVGDQVAHVVGLLVDDPEELKRLGGPERGRRPQHRGGRALDRAQRALELVAHHGQELGPEHLELLERRQVLHRDHHRLDLARLRTDGGRVDQRRDRPAVRRLEHDLLDPYRRRLAHDLLQRKAVQRHLPAVRPPHAQHLQQILRRLVRQAQIAHDPPRLGVHGGHLPASGVEHRHAHGRVSISVSRSERARSTSR